jgi:prepilin-type N-terminal cleavage/methylation domain-containing protein
MTITLSRRSSHGFTLIEMLVVVTIIGVLTALSFPAVGLALTAARKVEASTMMNQLRVALTSYEAEYGAWPAALSGSNDKEVTSDPGDQNDQQELFRTLIAYRNGGSLPSDNPRGTVFMEFNNKSLRASFPTGKGDVAQPASSKAAACFVDPWNQPYNFKVDSNYDNEIDVPGETVGSTVTVNTAIAIWSRGPQAQWNGEDTPGRTFIKSWK